MLISTIVSPNQQTNKQNKQNEMDYNAEVESAFQELEWDELLSTLDVAMIGVSQDTPIPAPPPPPPPPPVPAAYPQPGESLSVGYGGYTPLGAAPHMAEQPGPSNAGQAAPVMYQGPLYGQSAMWSWPYMPYNLEGGYNLGQVRCKVQFSVNSFIMEAFPSV